MYYEIALKEKEFEYGLDRSDVVELLDKLENTEVYPIELEASDHECSAMGFIATEAARELDYDYDKSGLHDFIANILDDMSNETEDCSYEFNGLKIWLSR